MEKCIVCQSTNLKVLLSCDHFPYFTVPVSKNAELEILTQFNHDNLNMNLIIKGCCDCGHCRQVKLPDFDVLNKLYSDYYHYPSPLENNFKPERDDVFVELAGSFLKSQARQSKATSILEVACFDGYALYQFKKMGYQVCGVDPSDGALIGRKHGLNIHKAFYDPRMFLNRNETFDVVISRHFLEHVVEPSEYIEKFKQVLRPNGTLVIEVPNAAYYLSRGLMEVFSPQHIQGFTKHSLSKVLNDAGLSVLELIESKNNLIAFSSVSPKAVVTPLANYTAYMNQYVDLIAKNKATIKETVQHYLDSNKTIALWGAGGFAVAAIKLYGIAPKNISFIIDSDPKKCGLSFIGMTPEIINVDKLQCQKVDLIIIASMYSDSIVKQIENLDSEADILMLYPTVKVLERAKVR
jgi:2-polyprenyl-3-methyl-5-hydroxy-6-metoxy-1,4-benzoquinol methylase